MTRLQTCDGVSSFWVNRRLTFAWRFGGNGPFMGVGPCMGEGSKARGPCKQVANHGVETTECDDGREGGHQAKARGKDKQHGSPGRPKFSLIVTASFY